MDGFLLLLFMDEYLLTKSSKIAQSDQDSDANHAQEAGEAESIGEGNSTSHFQEGRGQGGGGYRDIFCGRERRGRKTHVRASAWATLTS